MRSPLLRLPAKARPALTLICIAALATAVPARAQEGDGEPAAAKPPSPPGRWEMWDERCTQHFAVADHYPQRREMARLTVSASA